MTRQQNVWNPPPCFNDYSKIASDPWTKLASLVTLLDNNQFCSQKFSKEEMSGRVSTFFFLCFSIKKIRKIFLKNVLNWEKYDLDYDLVKLHEDFTFAGFTPLLDVKLEPIYVHQSLDMDVAEVSSFFFVFEFVLSVFFSR